MIVPREGRKKGGREGQRERRKAEAKIKNITNITIHNTYKSLVWL